MLVFSSLACCGFAQENKEEEKKESSFTLVVTCLAAAIITVGASCKAYLDYWKSFTDGYKKVKNL